jgi:hypothetical protein
MPKTPIDYSKCCIYKIEHIENDNLVYVGHTTNWDKRKTAHKSNCNNENEPKYNLKLYQMLRDNGGWDMFKMVEVEKCPCNDKREAERRENEVMKELKANMNSKRSYITGEELKEEKKLYKKNYYDMNKDIILEKQKVYNGTRIEALKCYKKEYNENNNAKLKEQKKIWYEKNKERVKALQKEYYINNKKTSDVNKTN